MLHGNHEAKKLLQTYLQQNSVSWASKANFLVLHGPKNVGKSSISLEIIQELLWVYIQSNLLHIKDFSEVLGKTHAIKVEEQDGTEEYKTLRDDHHYRDMGVRELNVWLQQSWFGAIKVLLIENIERMTLQAANAFLKTCEEPLPNKIIIATTANTSKVLDTILSRAILIPFVEVAPDQMLQIAKEHQIVSENPALQEIMITMAMGRPGALLSFNTLLNNDQELKKDMQQLLSILPHPGNLWKKHKMLTKFVEQGIIDQFLDGRIAYTTQHNLIAQSKRRLAVKKMLQTNVQIENVILYGLLE